MEAHPGTRAWVQNARYSTRRRYRNPAQLRSVPAATLKRSGRAEKDDTAGRKRFAAPAGAGAAVGPRRFADMVHGGSRAMRTGVLGRTGLA